MDYQLKMIRTLSILFFLCAFAPAVFAVPSAKTPDDIRFEIQAASLGTSNDIKYISLDFVLSNESTTKKINFDERASNYILSDEFDNHYRLLTLPVDAQAPIKEKKPSNFPSIYPGEACAKSLSFEAPVPKAERLKLEITGPTGSSTTPIVIEFPAPGHVPRELSVLDIISPEDGTVVTAGETFQLNVKVNCSELPFKIIVAAFGKTVENADPTENNTYNITIPAQTPKGPLSISVIGHWTDLNGRKQTLSRNVVIHVNPGPQTSR